jgi:hypothetical protein
MTASTILRRVAGVASLCGGLLLWPLLAQASGVAVVTDLQGRSTITTAGRSADAGILSDIQAGSQAQLPANASLVVLYLADGSEYQIKGPAQVVFRADRPEVSQGAPAVRRPAPAAGNLRIKTTGVSQGAIVMRSLGSTRILLLAGNGTLVLDAQPELGWMPPAPDLRYSLDIADDTGRSLLTAEVAATSLQVPAGLGLREGSTYTWEVSARGPDGRKYSGRGEFGVATAPLRSQVTTARGQADAAMSSQVALALWLEQQELRDEARRVWRELARQRPDEARLRAMAER